MKNNCSQQNGSLWRLKAPVAAGALLLLTADAFPCRSQTAAALRWPDSLNTAKEADYMTKTEQEVIHELNKVRTNPKAYALYLKEERQYYKGNDISKPGEITVRTREGLRAVNECIAALAKAKPVNVLHPHKGLSEAAGWLAADQAKTGQTGHSGSDGSTLPQRVERHYSGSYISIGENIAYGGREAQQIVMQLLIDDDVPSRGHRHNIMSAAFDCCGVAINTHSVYRHVCVMDFGKFRKEE
jgi:uncharacterized protein YkwD